jgi:hypothetical protein
VRWAATLMLLSGVVSAQSQKSTNPGPTATPPALTATDGPFRRYPAETLLVDASALVLVITGAAVQSGPVAASGGVVYLLGAPFVHLYEGDDGSRFASSLGLRVGLPVLGALTGLVIGSQHCDADLACGFRALGVSVLLAGAGVLGAVAIDAEYIAKRRQRPQSALLLPRIGPDWVGAQAIGTF